MIYALILLALAIGPGLAICIYIYWQDKFEKEPRHLLIKSFILGMLSTIPALILEIVAKNIGLIPESKSMAISLIACVIGIGLSEEISKYFFIRFYAYQKSEFNEPFDGITYTVMVSVGFATLENILYVFQSGITTGVLRMFTAVPAHAFFGVIIGYYLGLQKCKNKPFYGIIGLLLAALLHGLYDFFLFNAQYIWTIAGAIASLIIGYKYSRKAIRIHQEDSPFKN